MKYFISKDKELYAYEDDAPKDFVIEKIVTLGLTEVTDEEYQELLKPSLDELKTSKIAHFTYLRDTLRYDPIEYQGHRYQADEKTTNALIQALTVYTALGEVPDDFTWYDVDNNPIHLELNDLRILVSVITKRANDVIKRCRELKDAIAQASSEEELNKINW